MLDIRDHEALPRERALADGLKDVIAELRLVDVADYVAYLRLAQYGNLRDIVMSASELSLKPGVLRFADSGDVLMGWGSTPIVRLAMEFAHAGVTIHFQLELGASAASVDITYAAFAEAGLSREQETTRLRSAVALARLAEARHTITDAV